MVASEDKETPNREFERQMRRFKRAFEPGTEEYAIRKAYPGPEAAARRCDNPECLNTDFPATTTYWLCDECSAVAPCVVEALTHCPYKTLPTRRKRAQANRVAYSVWCRKRPRPSRPTRTEDVESQGDDAVRGDEEIDKAGSVPSGRPPTAPATVNAG